MVKSKEFDDSLSSVERKAWRCLISVIENFLGNNRAPNYEELIKNMLDAFHEMGVNMSLKVHFLANHLDFFPENLGAFSDEHPISTNACRIARNTVAICKNIVSKLYNDFIRRNFLCHSFTV